MAEILNEQTLLFVNISVEFVTDSKLGKHFTYYALLTLQSFPYIQALYSVFSLPEKIRCA